MGAQIPPDGLVCGSMGGSAAAPFSSSFGTISFHGVGGSEVMLGSPEAGRRSSLHTDSEVVTC